MRLERKTSVIVLKKCFGQPVQALKMLKILAIIIIAIISIC